MEENHDEELVTVKPIERRSYTRFSRRRYEVYSSFKEFIQISDPKMREPGRVKSLSFKRRRLSHCVEESQNTDHTSVQDKPLGRQLRISRSQPDLCTNCKLSITNTDDLVVQLHEELYHVYCFQCVQCGSKIDPKVDYLLIEDGKPLCGSCIPECRACGETILSNHVHVVDKDYHEKCLLCTFCRKVISK